MYTRMDPFYLSHPMHQRIYRKGYQLYFLITRIRSARQTSKSIVFHPLPHHHPPRLNIYHFIVYS